MSSVLLVEKSSDKTRQQYENPVVRRHLDRRIKARHLSPSLEVTAKRKMISLWFTDQLIFSSLDFNRYGMALTSKRRLKKGDRLAFSFRGPYIRENGIEGSIANVNPTASGFRYGVVFGYALKPSAYSREIDNALSRIERIFSQLS